MFEEEIDHLHSPKIVRQILSSLRLEQFVQERRRARALGDGLEEFRGRLSDAVVAEQTRAQSREHPAIASDLFLAGGLERVENFIDQRGIVRRVNGHGIAHFVGDSGTLERNLEMAGVLLRVGTV